MNAALPTTRARLPVEITAAAYDAAGDMPRNATPSFAVFERIEP